VSTLELITHDSHPEFLNFYDRRRRKARIDFDLPSISTIEEEG